ncbi:MAG: fumarylacetoacetate hydrolase family protein [Flavobacteriaceae bacterium]|nr:fumarylacetoacetate hydrolase family protein [Flavobacteriaceae bacterium]
MKLYKTPKGNIIFTNKQAYNLPDTDWDALLKNGNLIEYLQHFIHDNNQSTLSEKELNTIALAPIKNQEVWAAGVTYYRSKTARMEESKVSGGSSFYDKVYEAERPELFFKSTPQRVCGPGENVRIRKDSRWSVPEPELTLVVSSTKKIIGYTAGNDMSARDIEGENPLYLPQAKSYTGSTALGPCIFITNEPLSLHTQISLSIFRKEKKAFEGHTTVAEIKRSFSELIEFLFSEMDFPKGCFLMTGTGIVPSDDFTLKVNDRIEISIEGIGTLINEVGI